MTMRALAIALAMIAASCGGTQPAHETPLTEAEAAPSGEHARTPSAGRPPTAEERAAIDRLFRIAERVRGLSFVRPVPVEVQDRDAVVAHLTAQMEEEDLDTALVVYGALGLLDPEEDLRALLVRVLGEQVVGYYDPKIGKLVVRDDVMRRMPRSEDGAAMDEARMVLVHEMVHALQDQRLGLGETYDVERDSDPDNAFRSLVEGDATLAMIGYLAQRGGADLEALTRSPGLIRGLTGEIDAVPGAELEQAPAILRVTLVAAYLEGLVFSAELHGRGGWPAVDAAYERLPVSSEQVLHPDKYLANEPPIAVSLPAFPKLEEAGLTVVEEDTLGELEISVYLALGSRSDTHPSAAAGWGGDRLRVYRDGEGRGVAVWFTAWDSERDAREAEAAARIAAGGSTAPPTHRVERIGRAVLLLRGLDPALHDSVRAEFATFARSL